MKRGTVFACGLNCGGEKSRTVLLLLPLLLLPDSPATTSSPAVVYPCRSGDVQREGGEDSSPMQEPDSGRS